jgi:ketosteroid isomerase-like protein
MEKSEGTTKPQTSRTTPEKSVQAADRLFRSIERGDISAIREVYSPNAKIWHNNDGKTQTVEENLAVLKWVTENIGEISYSATRLQATETGFVQQHVLRGRLKASGKQFEIPACIVCTVEDGRITRLDEYLDSAHTAVFL